MQVTVGQADGASTNASDVLSATCMTKHQNSGHYNGLSVFVKSVQLDSLILSRDDLLELKIVRVISNTARYLMLPLI